MDILPRILFDDANSPGELIFDEYGRRDSLGPVTRSFDDINNLKITAEGFYGSELASESENPSGYRFSRWLDQSFNQISQTNEVTIENSGQKRVYAIYERIGDQEVPEVEEFNEVRSVGNLVTYEVIFSEPVVGVDIEDFVVGDELPGVAIRRVSGSGSRRLVEVDASKVPDGVMTVRLADNDSIMDPTGNSLAGDGKGNGDRSAEFEQTGGVQVNLSHFAVSEGFFSFTLNGLPTTEYRIESSSALNGAWDMEESVTTDASGTYLFVDSEPASGRKFFRAVKLP